MYIYIDMYSWTKYIHQSTFKSWTNQASWTHNVVWFSWCGNDKLTLDMQQHHNICFSLWLGTWSKTSPKSEWLTGKHLPSAQVVSSKNGGKHLDPMKLGKVKQPNSVSRICSSRVCCGFETAGGEAVVLISELHFTLSEVQKSKQRPLLSTTTTVGGCSILNRVPAMNTFRTCVSKSSKASFSSYSTIPLHWSVQTSSETGLSIQSVTIYKSNRIVHAHTRCCSIMIFPTKQTHKI